jgi:hypothetical protein
MSTSPTAMRRTVQRRPAREKGREAWEPLLLAKRRLGLEGAALFPENPAGSAEVTATGEGAEGASIELSAAKASGPGKMRANRKARKAQSQASPEDRLGSGKRGRSPLEAAKRVIGNLKPDDIRMSAPK